MGHLACLVHAVSGTIARFVLWPRDERFARGLRVRISSVSWDVATEVGTLV